VKIHDLRGQELNFERLFTLSEALASFHLSDHLLILSIVPTLVYLSPADNCRKGYEPMKKDIHPEYRDVIFQDTSNGTRFLLKSTIQCKETDTWDDGTEYPLFKVEITSASHPFYTGKMKFVDTAGRVEKFQKKYNWGKKQAAATEETATEEAK
jgi:large subunit ribosomal protein L31